MTNSTGDCKGQEDSEEEEDIDYVSEIKKSLDKLKALKLLFSKDKSLKLSNEKSQLASQKSNLLLKSSGYLKSKDQQESENIHVVDDDDSGKEEEYEDEYEEEYEDEDEEGLIYEIRFNEDNHLAMDDSDGDEDARAYFSCPFCYMDIEVHVLCSHLQDEHCFDLKNAVCPLCAANLGKDVMGHFIVQHSSSLKRRRKPLKSGLWTFSSAMIGKELSSFLGSSTNGRTNSNESAPDPLLSPFLGSVSHSHPKGSQQDESTNRSAHSKSTEISSLDGGSEIDSEERRQRAAFVQELIASTIF